MTMAFIFWVLMLIWLLFGIYGGRIAYRGRNGNAEWYYPVGGGLLLFLLLFVLGWRVFGFPIQG